MYCRSRQFHSIKAMSFGSLILDHQQWQSHLLQTIPFDQMGLSDGSLAQTFLAVVTHLIGCLLCFDLARRKNRGPLFWAWMGLLVGPLAAIVLMFIPNRNPRVD